MKRRLSVFVLFFFGLLFISVSPQKKKHFPKFKVDKESMTVYSRGKDWIQDVTMYKWNGELPDSIPDTLRFFANNAVRYSNENIWNRMCCSQLSWKLGEEPPLARMFAALSRACPSRAFVKRPDPPAGRQVVLGI